MAPSMSVVSSRGLAARSPTRFALVGFFHSSAVVHMMRRVWSRSAAFVKAASNPATPFDHLIEEIDIGGPSLVRGAAKNFQDVMVVVSPADYDGVLAQLDAAALERRIEGRDDSMLELLQYARDRSDTILYLEPAERSDRYSNLAALSGASVEFIKFLFAHYPQFQRDSAQ